MGSRRLGGDKSLPYRGDFLDSLGQVDNPSNGRIRGEGVDSFFPYFGNKDRRRRGQNESGTIRPKET